MIQGEKRERVVQITDMSEREGESERAGPVLSKREREGEREREGLSTICSL